MEHRMEVAPAIIEIWDTLGCQFLELSATHKCHQITPPSDTLQGAVDRATTRQNALEWTFFMKRMFSKQWMEAQRLYDKQFPPKCKHDTKAWAGSSQNSKCSMACWKSRNTFVYMAKWKQNNTTKTRLKLKPKS